jgi:hypothetical protein
MRVCPNNLSKGQKDYATASMYRRLLFGGKITLKKASKIVMGIFLRLPEPDKNFREEGVGGGFKPDSFVLIFI